MNELAQNSIEHWLPIIEAMIFASPQPMPLAQLEQILQDEGQALDRALLKEALESLQQASEGRAVALVEVASGYQYRVKPEFASWLAKQTKR